MIILENYYFCLSFRFYSRLPHFRQLVHVYVRTSNFNESISKRCIPNNVSCIGIMGKTRLHSFLSLSIEMTEWSVHIINTHAHMHTHTRQ